MKPCGPCARCSVSCRTGAIGSFSSASISRITIANPSVASCNSRSPRSTRLCVGLARASRPSSSPGGSRSRICSIPSVPDMGRALSRQEIEDQHWVRRYVAGELNDVESVAFEDFLVAHPDVARQVELEQRMTAGLARVGHEEFAEAPRAGIPPWWLATAACVLLGVAAMTGVKQGWLGGGPKILMAATP